MLWIAFLLVQSAVTPQIERGEALFFDATKGCASCHALKGRGTAVGPSLRGIGRLAPRAITTAIRSTVTQYVQTATLKDKTRFPAMPASEADQGVQVFDLSKTPPELRKFAKDEVTLGSPDGSWTHPPATAGYSNEQMADIVGYIRYAASGSQKTVEPSEVQ